MSDATLEKPEHSFGQLRRTVSPLQFFALGFGCIIGAAWIVSLGEILDRAGPGGAILGFALGGAAMLAVGACYAELAAQIPQAGSEFIYCLRVYGRSIGFMVGWFVTLFLVSVTIFEAVALAWTIQILLPQLQGPALYVVFGHAVTVTDLVIGVSGTLLLALINYRGTAISVRFNSIVTFGFIAVTVAVIVWCIAFGAPHNLLPVWPTAGGRTWWTGTFWVFSSCAFFLYGFPAIPQTIEERRSGVPLRTLAVITILSIFAATLFYVAIIVSTAMAVPWTSIAGQQLAMAAALEHLPLGHLLATVILFAAAASILKTWNAVYLMAARMLLAQARESFMPLRLRNVHPRFGSPSTAIVAVGVLNFAGLFWGRAAIVPIINMSSMCLTVTFVLCCVAVLILRRRHGDHSSFRAPGGLTTVWIAITSSAVMAATALSEPFRTPFTVLPFEWILLLLWAAVGITVATIIRSKPVGPGAQNAIEFGTVHEHDEGSTR